VLVALALNDFAPGTISISSVPINTPVTIAIGNLSAASQDSVNGGDTAVQNDAGTGSLATTVRNLEVLDSYTYGFSTSPQNCAVGWPDLAYLRNESTVTYPSDAMCWSHQCSWQAPTFADGGNANSGPWVAPSMPNISWISTIQQTLGIVSAPSPSQVIVALKRLFSHNHPP
jgi:hypothetical protein